jgi:hypothetical protein
MSEDYTPEERLNMAAHLSRLRMLQKQNPGSICLRNAVNHIEKVLGIRVTVEKVEL